MITAIIFYVASFLFLLMSAYMLVQKEKVKREIRELKEGIMRILDND